jgi:hypothetical protein
MPVPDGPDVEQLAEVVRAAKHAERERIADLLYKARFDRQIGRAAHPDRFYAGVLYAVGLVCPEHRDKHLGGSDAGS